MPYLVTCTFDLKNGSFQDYENAYSDLSRMGLRKVVIPTQGGEIVAPTTMTVGQFSGQSSSTVRDDVRDAVKQAFVMRRLQSQIFVVVGENWAWGATST
jgi:hypothetical protein